jgi:hypothetical protein
MIAQTRVPNKAKAVSALRRARAAALLDLISDRREIRFSGGQYRWLQHERDFSRTEINLALDDLAEEGQIIIEAEYGTVVARIAEEEDVALEVLHSANRR